MKRTISLLWMIIIMVYNTKTPIVTSISHLTETQKQLQCDHIGSAKYLYSFIDYYAHFFFYRLKPQFPFFRLTSNDLWPSQKKNNMFHLLIGGMHILLKYNKIHPYCPFKDILFKRFFNIFGLRWPQKTLDLHQKLMIAILNTILKTHITPDLHHDQHFTGSTNQSTYQLRYLWK